MEGNAHSVLAMMIGTLNAINLSENGQRLQSSHSSSCMSDMRAVSAFAYVALLA
jgi:hypothetical protein